MSRKGLGFRKLFPLVAALALVLPLVLAFAGPVFAAPTTWWVDDDNCPGPGTGTQASPFCKIQFAVNAASGGDTINVRAGTYNESVNLSLMASPGDITLIAVDGPATAIVDGGALGDAIHTGAGFPGHVTIDGFVVDSDTNGLTVSVVNDVDIRNVTASSTGIVGINVDRVVGKVTISNCTANNTGSDGMAMNMTGDVTISNCTANNSGSYGISLSRTGDVTISNCTANNNAIWGGMVMGDTGDVTISNCTASSNGGHGIRLHMTGNVTIADVVARGNSTGVSLGPGISGLSVNGSIICGNSYHGLELSSAMTVDATGNWWGCAAGPGNAGCDTINPGFGTVNSSPWIDTISSSATVDPVVAGEATVVSFQFSDGGQTVFLSEGPGDLHGHPTFTTSTDNGTLTDGGFINNPNGVLSVTLVPETGGTATVSVDGPCGLDDSITVGVLAAEFVPEPATILLLGSGLAGLAGYAGLRLRKR